MKQYVFFKNFKKFVNITSETVIDFTVGMFEGVITFNITLTESKGESSILDDQTSNVIKNKAKVLAISAGGAVVQAAPVILKVITGATPNLLI
jgi:hypothetical protein